MRRFLTLLSSTTPERSSEPKVCRSTLSRTSTFISRTESPTTRAGPFSASTSKNRWPIITFSLDPVTDQQNIADSFNLKRDLQLALSFAFATGQINFSQLSTFRRQIEQSSDTIALNRTITAFAHGADIFGFRFTPGSRTRPISGPISA